MSGRDANQRRGCVEIRWNEDDPDDVVAPWPRELDGTPILVHIERMDDDHIWLAIFFGAIIGACEVGYRCASWIQGRLDARASRTRVGPPAYHRPEGERHAPSA